MIFDWQFLFDSLKKQGLIAILLGAVIYLQYNAYERLKDEFKLEQKEMRLKLEKQIENLEIKLLNCEKSRIEELLRNNP
jgi:predicted nucleotide-binding protein (sugar kinase/HSP70/actin superfamily)